MGQNIAFHEISGISGGSACSCVIPEHNGHVPPHSYNVGGEFLVTTDAPRHTTIMNPRIKYYEPNKNATFQAVMQQTTGNHDPAPMLCPDGDGTPIPFTVVGSSRIKIAGVPVVFVGQTVDFVHSSGQVDTGHSRIKSDLVT